MIKKITYYLLLISTISSLIFSVYAKLTYSSFEAINVKNNIGVLSSSTYSGRLAGTDENYLVGELIRKKFQDSNLYSINNTKDSKDYYEGFKTLCPVPTNTKPFLTISKDDVVLHQLEYGVDFKEDMINFRNNSINFSNKDTVNLRGNYIEVITNGRKCLLYVAKNNDFSFRSSFMSDFQYDMVVVINNSTYSKIAESIKNDLEVSLHVPYRVEEKEIYNIVGKIKGINSKLPPLVFTAHYDHLGTDGLGNIYYGALDNASGTSFLLELQRSLSTFGKPSRDILFVALNAEEFGLLGSKNFADNNKDLLKDSEVINFDMIGAENYPITFMEGSKCKDNNSDLLLSLQNFCNKEGVKFDVTYQDSSDHASFNDLGIDSLSFCHSDMSKIHTPNDTTEHISIKAIDDVYSIIWDKLSSTTYNPFVIFIYSKYSIIILSCLLLVQLAYPIINKKIRNNHN